MVRVHLGPPLSSVTHLKNGGVAQLGEHLPCTQGVIGSIPFTSTILKQIETKIEIEKLLNLYTHNLCICQFQNIMCIKIVEIFDDGIMR